MLIIWIVIFVIGIYYGQRYLYEKLWDRKLNVKVWYEDAIIEAGQSSRVIAIIENAKMLPLPIFNLKLSAPKSFVFDDMEHAAVTDLFYRSEAFSIMGKQRVTRKLGFQGTRRGYFEIASVNTVVKDLFFVKTYAKNYDTDTTIYVLPRKLQNTWIIEFEKAMLGEIETKRSFIEDPFSFRGIRDYSATDSMGRVNWKASAKTSELKVNMYNKVAEQRVSILINLDAYTLFREDELREYSISLASTLTKDFVAMGVPVMVFANGLDVVTGEKGMIQAGSTRDHSVVVDKYLARIGTMLKNDTFMETLDQMQDTIASNITYIVISPYYKNDLLEKLDELKNRGVDLHMIVPYDHRDTMECDRTYVEGWEVNADEMDT
ncbi:MAG: DUF58 domain-containing protein [Eubacteriales bacterium]|nr:DUF58 domain-containing protein [Eubacteriales bacterium]